MTFQINGLVIKSEPYKEFDRLYTIYTKEKGKLLLRAQGVRKINSKQAGHLEPFNFAQILVAQSHGFHKIAGVTQIKCFQGIISDAAKLLAANTILYTFDRSVFSDQADQEIFDLLYNFLVYINDHSYNKFLFAAFIFKFYQAMGYEIPLHDKEPVNLKKIVNFCSLNNWQTLNRLKIDDDLWIIIRNKIKTLQNYQNII